MTEGFVGSHSDANSDNACDVCGTSMGTVIPPQSGSTYVKVTQTPTDWTGQYLIVYESGKLALNGALTTMDVARNTIPVTISNNTIVLDEEYAESYFTIAVNGSGYSIKSSSGYYIGHTNSTNSNKLYISTSTAYVNTFGWNSDNSIKITSNTMTLRFNSNKDQMRFRYYGSGQQPVALYKLKETHTHA